MYSVLGNHKTMTHRYTVNVIHIYRGIIVFTQQFYKDITFKKNKFNTKSDQNIHQDALNCTFFQNFLAG